MVDAVIDRHWTATLWAGATNATRDFFKGRFLWFFGHSNEDLPLGSVYALTQDNDNNCLMAVAVSAASKSEKGWYQEYQPFSLLLYTINLMTVLSCCRQLIEGLKNLLLLIIIELCKGIDKGTVRCFEAGICHKLQPPI